MFNRLLSRKSKPHCVDSTKDAKNSDTHKDAVERAEVNTKYGHVQILENRTV
jgi:hypothetical protein